MVPNDRTYVTYTSRDILSHHHVKENHITILDWKGERGGLETAEYLALQGKSIELISSTYSIGEMVQQYVRNQFLARLDSMNVKFKPHFTIHEMGEENITIKHLFSNRFEKHQTEAVVCTRLLCTRICREIKHQDIEIRRVGDALNPRDLDHAVWEGFKAVGHRELLLNVYEWLVLSFK